jgi:hypothetical protein
MHDQRGDLSEGPRKSSVALQKATQDSFGRKNHLFIKIYDSDSVASTA